MGQTADQLRQEIEQKREDAASKIDQIESRVTDTTQMVRDTVQDLPQMAKETVSGTVEQVKQNVQNVDLRQQIQERPLVALGAALAGGFLLGGIMGGGEGGQQHRGGQYAGMSQGGTASGLRGAVKSSGLDETINGLAGAVMGMLTERVRSTVEQNFPQIAERMPQPQSSGSSGSSQSMAGSPSRSGPAAAYPGVQASGSRVHD